MIFTPDYHHLLQAACNMEAQRLPLYEHLICTEVMEEITGCHFASLLQGNNTDKREFFTQYCRFYRDMGYDTVSFEQCIGGVMPGGGALGSHADPIIKTQEDFDRYPWEEIPDLFFQRFDADFEALREVMPDGMKAVGGPGNGIFECVQEVVGYMNLCYIAMDDPELYAALFRKVGDINFTIWRRFLEKYGNIYCVMRFGDDMGHKTNTLLSKEDIEAHLVPQYKRIVNLVHAYQKPFLLHSCGCIFNVMDTLINTVGIDAKHSNEDQIAPFSYWVTTYGDRIGNFGGIDTDAVCRLDKSAMTEYIRDVIRQCSGHGGFAFGSGNSIPDYVPADQFLHMVETVRRERGE